MSLCHEATSSFLKVKVMKIKDLLKSIKSKQLSTSLMQFNLIIHCHVVLPRFDLAVLHIAENIMLVVNSLANDFL